MRQALVPMLFHDHEREAAEAPRSSPVARAPRSPAARRKDKTKKTPDGMPVHSLQTLLHDLGTIAKNLCRPAGVDAGPTFTKVTTPTPIETKAFEVLGLTLRA